MVWFQEKILAELNNAKIEAILRKYDNFKVKSFDSQSGWQNLILKVDTNSGDFILRIHRNRRIERLNRVLDVIDFLEKRNFPVQKFLLTKAGEKITKVENKNGHPAVLFKYIKGETKQFLTKSELSEIGKLLALLHINLSDFLDRNRLIKSFSRINLITIFNSAEKSFEGKFKNDNLIYSLWNKFSPEILNSLAISKTVLSKTSLIHGDLAPSNIVFNKSKIVALLDFDNMSLAPKIYDLVNFIGNYSQVLKSWGKKQEISEIAKNLLTGYEKELELTEKEIQLILPSVRLWLLRKIIWGKKESAKKYRQKWANEVISWLTSTLKENF